jgi:hypothetical protein
VIPRAGLARQHTQGNTLLRAEEAIDLRHCGAVALVAEATILRWTAD